MISSITCRCHASSRHALTRPVRPSTGLLYSTGVHHRAAVARRYSFRIGHALTVTSLDLKGKINASAVHCAGTGSRDPVGRNRNAIRIRPPNPHLISHHGWPAASWPVSEQQGRSTRQQQQPPNKRTTDPPDRTTIRRLPSVVWCGNVHACVLLQEIEGTYYLPARTSTGMAVPLAG